jgi:putative N-acetyltransferase (TIGR04045 family)
VLTRVAPIRTMLDLPVPVARAFTVVRAEHDPALLEAYADLRRRAFVDEQHLFQGHDLDEHDGAPGTRVLVALDEDARVIGGVRLHPVDVADDAQHWRGSRLVCSGAGGPARGLVGALLVREACSQALDVGATHFDAHVQLRYRHFFERLGWDDVRAVEVAGTEHRLMVWPIPTTTPTPEHTR